MLKAMRPEDDATLTINALVDGARDQLFLALKLGGISRHIENSGCIPFIVDDVLVHFDGERSSAALQSMACLAEKNADYIFFASQALSGFSAKKNTWKIAVHAPFVIEKRPIILTKICFKVNIV